MKEGASNPVAPTTFSRVNPSAETPAPVAPPVASVAEALAATANALLAMAQALQGNPAPGPAPLSHNPPPDNTDKPAAGCRNFPMAVGTVKAFTSTDANGPTVAEAVNEFLVAKARAGRSDRYLRQLRVSLSSFARGRAGRALSDIELSEVERWLFWQGWKARTMRGYLADVRTMFNFALRRGMIRSLGPVQVELPITGSGALPPCVHPPDAVRRVLEAARGADLSVMRHLAIRYFTGIRTAEAHRLAEADLLLDRGFVEVTAVKAKTRRRRLVSVQPNLAAWLALGGSLRPLSPDTIRRVIRAAGVPWPANVTRHSFCTYHLAAFENAGKTALEAGHSEPMLFAHYRAVVTSAQAKEFWNITPK